MTACKAVYTGSIPVGASNEFHRMSPIQTFSLIHLGSVPI